MQKLHCQRDRRLSTLLLMGVATALMVPPNRSRADDDAKFFESEVRPLLVGECIKCHGPDQQKGGLRLDARDFALAGGQSGPVIEPGRPDESLLIEAVRQDGLKMPPKKRLSDQQVQVLERWVEQGAHWPADGQHGNSGTVALRQSPGDFSPQDRAWWAIQPLSNPTAPVADAWCRNPIDAFIAERRRGQGLIPAPEADRLTLIRRVTFDLTGLPPTPDEAAAFASDTRPDAYERLVDRLLQSPRFGQRWARHWLDLVRYAESDGYKADGYRPEAWRYRDYVVEAFNRDVPYDQFVTEQLAGDELDPNDPHMRVAASYLRLWPYEYNQRDVEGQWSAILNDLTDVTADVFLGVGLSCARCHDHKFDPILQTDYYRIQAFFTPLMPRDDLPLVAEQDIADRTVQSAAWDLMTAHLRERIAALEAPHRKAARADALAKFQPHLQAILLKPDAARTPRERQLAYFMQRQVVEEFGNLDARIKGDEKKKYEELKKQLRSFDRFKPPEIPRALTATDVGGPPPETNIPGRRNAEDIAPGFLAILGNVEATLDTPASDAQSTGRRLALARWITRPDHPLTTRVIVNRLWQYHFGRGLVATSSDFGRLGESPSHPALLDWLAQELVRNRWSLKHLHRLMVTSAAYRQAAQTDPEQLARARAIDPENRLIWERRPARLEAEPLRDAMLCASGELRERPGGPAAESKQPARAIHTRQARNTPDPLMAALDAPDGSASTPSRNVTTTAIQALDLINGAWTLERAQALARRVQSEETADTRVDRLYRLLIGRPPTVAELAAANAFLYDQTARAFTVDVSQDDARKAAFVDLCHVMLNSSAFLYVE